MAEDQLLGPSRNHLVWIGTKMRKKSRKRAASEMSPERLSGCKVTEEGYSFLASALRTNLTNLTELNLVYYQPGDSRVVLKDFSCKLEMLNAPVQKVDQCGVTKQCCSAFASTLKSNPSLLRELSLSHNDLQDSGVMILSAGLRVPHCKLEILRLAGCRVTEEGCSSLASALRSNPSHLRELDLSYNHPGDSGVKLLSAVLKDPSCKLEKLKLAGCRVTEEGCSSLASALRSNPSHLRELDLSYNHPGDSGVKLLSAVLEDPSCKLEKLKLDRCELTERCCEALASILRSKSSHLRELHLNNNDLQDSGVKLLSAGLGDSHCKLGILRLSGCRVTEEGCSSLASALSSNPSHVRELDLSYNHPGDSGVKLLSAVLKDHSCKLEKLKFPFCRLSSCRVSGKGCLFLASALKSNPSHLRELDLRYNQPGESGLKLISFVQKDPRCKLQMLRSNMEDTTKLMESEKPSSLQHSVTVAWNWMPELVSGNKHLFIPDVVETSNMREYRFQAKHPGRFFCCVTGLVFVMESSGEVIYSFCSWEIAPKALGNCGLAGPLFNIECPQGTLKELHLPHCEMSSADENLAVAHVTKDNMEILWPQEVTDTHVVISVTSLSGFGVIKRILNFIKRKIFRKVRGQVLLLLRPIDKILNVFLLPLNVPPDQVHQQELQRQNILIPTSSKCTFIHNERYRMSSDEEAIRWIQPEIEEFECDFDPTIHPTFEVQLNRDVVEVELSVLEEKSGKVVWRRIVNLRGAVSPSPSTTDTAHRQVVSHHSGVAFVDQHREAIIQRVTLIDPILDDLHEHIGEEKYSYIRAASTSQERMRKLYEVLNSDELKKLFFDSLKKKESSLVLELLGL
ncbi:NACHT, LRR and PYD domains-containing protein 1a allele 5-like isoform X5 [Paramormyrops kingsleyae]|uniref:NACHT, LRR and PYD domains-containing protein 1a allele 5-like isoform X5 n=1 Tax=Paramormyrops kingsleyae TaxID=1676925 RepID=UPI003B96B8E8